MQELKMLENKKVLGKDFRVYGNLEEPLFLAKDVAGMIEHSDPSKMLKMVDEDEKLIRTIFVSGQKRQVAMLTENGLYEVLMQSRKPIAKEFKREVKKILREIRQKGSYIPNNIPPKNYKGVRVMTLRDLSSMIGVEHSSIGHYCVKATPLAKVLTGKELANFKRRNPNKICSSVPSLIVITKEEALKIAKVAGKMVHKDKIDEYYNINNDTPEKQDVDMQKLKDLSASLESLFVLRGEGTPYERAIYLLTQKVNADIYVLEQMEYSRKMAKELREELARTSENFNMQVTMRLN